MVFYEVTEGIGSCSSSAYQKPRCSISVAVLSGLAVALMFLFCVPAVAGESDRPDAGSEKVATIIYSCNTWGYLKPCST